MMPCHGSAWDRGVGAVTLCTHLPGRAVELCKPLGPGQVSPLLEGGGVDVGQRVSVWWDLFGPGVDTDHCPVLCSPHASPTVPCPPAQGSLHCFSTVPGGGEGRCLRLVTLQPTLLFLQAASSLPWTGSTGGTALSRQGGD